jgi:phosphatidylethanolamine-binding protein (PEBP) family uncharacterized protein
MRRRAALLALVALAGCGGEKLARGDLPTAPATLRLSSTAFAGGATLPRRYTCDGGGDEPAVRVAGVPSAAREQVTVVSDPDAPGGTFVHLTRYGSRTGTNSAGDRGWTPPCPPEGDDPHRYVWTVSALAEPSGLKDGAKPGAVAAALRAHDVIASGTLTARYGR